VETDVHVCVKIARARSGSTSFIVLYSSRTERTRTSSAFSCVRRPCGNGAFFSRTDFCHCSRTHRDALSIRMTIYTRVSGVLSESESQKRDRWTLLSSHDTSRCCQCFLYVDWKGKKYFRSLWDWASPVEAPIFSFNIFFFYLKFRLN